MPFADTFLHFDSFTIKSLFGALVDRRFFQEDPDEFSPGVRGSGQGKNGRGARRYKTIVVSNGKAQWLGLSASNLCLVSGMNEVISRLTAAKGFLTLAESSSILRKSAPTGWNRPASL